MKFVDDDDYDDDYDDDGAGGTEPEYGNVVREGKEEGWGLENIGVEGD